MGSFSTLNCYDEEYLDQAIVLDKYKDRTMTREEVHEMLECNDLKEFFSNNGNKSIAMKSVRATLISLGYDRNWISEMFEPELYDTFPSLRL